MDPTLKQLLEERDLLRAQLAAALDMLEAERSKNQGQKDEHD